jgi:(heptosyl)LPS beta-1,4-glucosyltransferase
MISAIVITKNEEKMISDCLRSLEFVDEKIVVDTGNTDNTNNIARSFGARVIKSDGDDYSKFRNDGFLSASHDWILFVDADERVTPELAEHLKNIKEPGVFQIPRQNYYLDQQMKYGGWGGDKIIRFFHRSLLKEYSGKLHEQPTYLGPLTTTVGSLVHYSHRGLTSMTNKTINFTSYESHLRFDSHHPPVVWWRIFRVMFTEFWLRFISLQAWRDGPKGVIDGIFQIYNTFIIYARLWELQQHHKGKS